MKPKKLPRTFYHRAAVDVARDLLGKLLVHRLPGEKRIGRIVETEAYIGPEDRACHASRGKTKRTTVMFGPPGFAYVYLIYGMYDCFNIVTEREGFPAAVLIRALEPVLTRESLVELNGHRKLERLASGPGKLSRFMQIDRKLNGEDLCGSVLYLEDRGDTIEPQDLVVTTRINIDYAGEWKDKPLRFYLKHSPSVSRR
jgi:DNA-3-methyladenine glycosylase